MNTLKLSDIFVPGTLSLEDYGHKRPTKIYLSGMHDAGKWYALYGELQAEAHKKILPNLVDGDVAAVQLIRQVSGEFVGKPAAVATPTCGIGSYKFAIVESLGDCVLPEPFKTLEDIVR